MNPSQFARVILREYKSAPVLYIAVAALILCVNLVLSSVGLMMYTIKWRAAPILHPSRLVGAETELSGPEYDMLRDANSANSGPFEDLFAWGDTGVNELVTLSSGDSTFEVSYALITGNTSGVMSLHAPLGRLLQPSDDAAAGGVGGWKATISVDTWRSIFNRDDKIIGKTIYINRIPVEIIGVQDGNVRSIKPTQHPAIYLPLAFVDVYIRDRSFTLRHNKNANWINVYGILRANATIEKAQAFLNATVSRDIQRPTLRGDPRIKLFEAGKGDHALSREYGNILTIIAELGSLLTVSCGIACSLLISFRFKVNSKGTAIRLALGATRLTLVRDSVAPILSIIVVTAVCPLFL